MKKIVIITCILFIFYSCSGDKKQELNNSIKETKIIQESDTVKVVSSILPLASIIQFIGQNEVEVQNLVPAGVSLHSFSLSPQDMIRVEKSDIVFLLGIEQIDGFLFKSLGGVKSIALDEGLKVLEGVEHEHEDHNAESEEGHIEEQFEYHGDKDNHDEDVHPYLDRQGEGHIHAETSIDPHVWTGKVNTLLMAKTIRDELSIMKPSKKREFETNYNLFERELESIFSKFEESISGKKQKEFIVFHDAYNYLFYDAGIDMDKKIVFRKNVLSDPHSTEMVELTDEVESHGLDVFFIEPQFKSTSLELLAKKNNSQIFILDPLGQDESASGYLDNVKNNLESLLKIYE